MAFGYSPKYIHDIPLENLEPEQFLILAIEAAKNLGWNIGFTGENGFIAYTPFSMSSWSEEVTVKIEPGFVSLRSSCTGNQLMDWGKNKKNINEFIAAIDELKATVTPEEIEQKLVELKPSLAPEVDFPLSNQVLSTKDKLNGVLAFFIPARGYFITPIIVNLNILVFIIMVIAGANVFAPDTQTLLFWGANFKPYTLAGGWWRLGSNFFLHIGILHLLFNMYALIYIGLLLEHHLGKLRFAAAYILTGIVASLTSLYWHDATVSAGASGAIFGMYGVFLAMLTTNFIERAANKALLLSIVVFVGFNLLSGVKEGIDNAAHIGGLLSGFIIGYLYYPSLKNPGATDLKLGTVGVLSFVILFISGMVYKRIPNDLAE